MFLGCILCSQHPAHYDCSMERHISLPLPPILAILCGLLVLWRIYDLSIRRQWTLYHAVLIGSCLVAYFCAIGVFSFYWIKPHRWSNHALLALLECSWLNSIAGLILVFLKITEGLHYRGIIIQTLVSPAVIQIVGFGLLFSQLYESIGRGCIFAGVFGFHLNTAIATYYLPFRVKVWILKVVFSVAVFSAVGIYIGCQETEWFFLVVSIQEFSVHFIVILLQVHGYIAESLRSAEISSEVNLCNEPTEMDGNIVNKFSITEV